MSSGGVYDSAAGYCLRHTRLFAVLLDDVIPFLYGNNVRGHTHGLELAANWSVASRCKLSGSYSGLRVRLEHIQPAGNWAQAGAAHDDGSPRRQARVSSYLELPRGLNFDVTLYYVDCSVPTPALASRPPVPAYDRLDARLGWAPIQTLDLSLGLQNPLDPRRAEYDGAVDLVTGNQIGRSVHGRIAGRF